jgi:arylsulfatase A-like enzyme
MLRCYLAAGVLFVVVLPAAAQAARTNVVLMMADDLGCGETSCNGYPYVKVPALDEMARGGPRLDRFCAASPVCSPTRASVMTGRHANRSGAFAADWSTRPEDLAPYAHLGKEISGRFAEIVAMNRAMGVFRAALDALSARGNTLVWFNSDNGISREGIPADQQQYLINGGWRGHKGQLYEGGTSLSGADYRQESPRLPLRRIAARSPRGPEG